MLRTSVKLQAGALVKHGLGVATRPTLVLALSRLPSICAAPSLTRFDRSYKTVPKHIRKRQTIAEEAGRAPAFLDDLKRLREAIDQNNVAQIAIAYNTIRNHITLGDQDVADIAKALHTALRLLSRSVRTTRIPTDITALADLLVLDIQAKVLPPSYDAHLHLLSFYKETAAFEKGIAFWSWLVKQPDTYVNASLYGVAIELFAFQGRPAEDTESLYEQALARFPGVFLEYHLSHNAVIADRSQSTVISGIPRALLQGIVTARILRGDAKNAYLTLDTTLRLFPTKLPSRFVTLFVQERPLDEAYKVFLLACRTGATPGHDALKILLTRLRKLALDKPLDNAALIRAMLMACYVHKASGAMIHNRSLNEIVIAITGLLKQDVFTDMSSDQLRPATDAMTALISDLFGFWASHNSPPGIASFNSMIANLAGRGKRKDTIDSVLEALKHYGLKPNAVTLRSILVAAGDLNDAEAVRSAWTDLVANRIAASAALDISDWQSLTSAARRLQDSDYVRLQLENFKHIVPTHILDRINGFIESDSFSRQPNPDGNPTLAWMETARLLKILQILRRDVACMAESAQLGHDFLTTPIPLDLCPGPSLHSHVPEEHVRTVYDEMTTDSSGPSILPELLPKTEAEADVETETEDTHAEAQPAAMSSTGYALDELRYQNWKIVNELLSEAEKHDKEYMDIVENSIKYGTPPPGRNMGLRRVPTLHNFTGLSDLTSRSSEAKTATLSSGEQEVTLDDFRQRIFELRGRKA